MLVLEEEVVNSDIDKNINDKVKIRTACLASLTIGQSVLPAALRQGRYTAAHHEGYRQLLDSIHHHPAHVAAAVVTHAWQPTRS